MADEFGQQAAPCVALRPRGAMFDLSHLDLPPLASAAGTVQLPGSKSISNRVLLLAGLCEGTTRVHDLLDSDDTRVMQGALRALGCGLDDDGQTLLVSGLGGRLAVHQAKLFLSGRNDELLRELKRKMFAASEELAFEEAARLRDAIPPIAASSGKAKRRRSLSSPRSNSRRASRPTTKKKNVISPLFTQWRRSSVTPAPPTSIESIIPQSAS